MRPGLIEPWTPAKPHPPQAQGGIPQRSPVAGRVPFLFYGHLRQGGDDLPVFILCEVAAVARKLLVSVNAMFRDNADWVVQPSCC